MTPAGADAVLVEETIPSSTVAYAHEQGVARWPARDQLVGDATYRESGSSRRRTPRRSLIVVLPENHVVPTDVVADHLDSSAEPDQIDVILACAGQPNGITALQRRVRDLQVLLAPAGTSREDLRELAMRRAPGDIVTLLNGTLLGG